MKSFLSFIKEEKSMPKLNEGDIIEGIFCLAVGLYLGYDTIDKGKLNSFRTVINPNNFVDGRERVFIVKDKTLGKDKLTVECIIRLKAATTSAAFGPNYNILYSKQSDIGKIDQKINNIISNISGSAFGAKLQNMKKKYVENSTEEELDFAVEADGIAGETSGGALKADVEVKLTVKNNKGSIIGQEKIPFSIKSKSKTLSNLSPYKGMLKFAKAFSINDSFITKSKNAFESKAITLAEKEAINKLIIDLYNELVTKIVSSSKSNKFSIMALNFIQKEIFGDDLADLIDIDNRKIKEITQTSFNNLKDNHKFIAIKSGQQMKIVDSKNTKDVLFSTRVKLRVSSSGSAERKFYIEAGKLLYNA